MRRDGGWGVGQARACVACSAARSSQAGVGSLQGSAACGVVGMRTRARGRVVVSSPAFVRCKLAVWSKQSQFTMSHGVCVCVWRHGPHVVNLMWVHTWTGALVARERQPVHAMRGATTRVLPSARCSRFPQTKRAHGKYYTHHTCHVTAACTRARRRNGAAHRDELANSLVSTPLRRSRPATPTQPHHTAVCTRNHGPGAAQTGLVGGTSVKYWETGA